MRVEVRLTIPTLIDREVDALDRLLAEVRGGIRGPAHFDELESRADAIGKRLRAAFRECPTKHLITARVRPGDHQ